MLEPPSASLLKTLSAHRLCVPRDLRRCRGYVRRLTRDLPAFDSAWIDGLVQSRRLTAYQAQCLETGQAARLSVGPCVLLERLGGTSFAETYLARRRDTRDVCVLKLTSLAPEQIKPLGERLSQLVSLGQAFEHPAIVLPQAVQVVEWPLPGAPRLVAISPQVRGPHLAELLIRRGRFPLSIVVELGRLLLDGLAALESRGLTHGDIALSNVRITRHGQAVLVDGGFVPALRPEFSFHTILGPEHYDGLAPERITTGQPPTVASDIYSLGCLLWHLLAGRPPFTAGDPLAKIAAHQTQPISDIREWVPDTPDGLAETLRSWTSANPTARPRSFREAAAALGPPTRAGRRRLAMFRGAFDRTAPRREQTETSTRWPFIVASIFVLSGAVLSLFDQGARNDLLSLAHRVRGGLATTAPSHSGPAQHRETREEEDASEVREVRNAANVGVDGDSATQQHVLRAITEPPRPLPEPNAAGRITLAPGARYTTADVATREVLEIIGDARHPPEIVINEQPLSVWAESVRLHHVRIVRSRTSVETQDSSRPQPLIVADCQQLEILGCRFEHSDDATSLFEESDSARRRGAAVAWRPQEPRDHAGTRLTFRDNVFAGTGPSTYLHSLPVLLSMNNILKVGGGDFVQCRDDGAVASTFDLRQVTLRQSGPALRWWSRRDGAPLSLLTLMAHGCVWDLADDPAATSATDVRPTLVAWMARRLPPNWDSAIDWRIAGAFLTPNSDVVALVNPTNGRRTPVDESRLNIDGLLASTVEFSGPISLRPHDSRIQSFDAPWPADTPLGIRSERLVNTENQGR